MRWMTNMMTKTVNARAIQSRPVLYLTPQQCPTRTLCTVQDPIINLKLVKKNDILGTIKDYPNK